MQEKIYDVVWSGDRKPGEDGKVPLIGSTVDVQVVGDLAYTFLNPRIRYA